MRKKEQKQLPLMPAKIDHPHALELEFMSRILDSNPIINDLAFQDLTRKIIQPNAGANGMTAEQVVRAAVIKQMNEYSYEELSFHLVDSQCYRRFCRIGIADGGYKSSALCSNIKALSPETWEAIHRILISYAENKVIEKGRMARIDCTVVNSNIHEPTDSSLLWDSVRVLARTLGKVKEQYENLRIPFTDHTRRAKRRMLGIMNAKKEEKREKLYGDLLKVTKSTVNYAKKTVDILLNSPMSSISQMTLVLELQEYITLSEKVIDQTHRRVLLGESVPASEKVVSIFEPHTDIIVKDRRDTFYGHKVCLTGGASNLILDCYITDGNPADTSLTERMLDRQKEIYGRYPLKVAFDGGFASKENLEKAKTKKIKDVCFGKKRGLKVEDMCRSSYVYKKLRRFRAGIEAGISLIKRCFGFSICTWKGYRSFKSYVWSSIVSVNLLTLARAEIA